LNGVITVSGNQAVRYRRVIEGVRCERNFKQSVAHKFAKAMALKIQFGQRGIGDFTARIS